MLVATLSLIVLTCVALLVPVPYVTMSPGALRHARQVRGREGQAQADVHVRRGRQDLPDDRHARLHHGLGDARRQPTLAVRRGRGLHRPRQGRRPQGSDLSGRRDGGAVLGGVGRAAPQLQGLLARRRAARCRLHRDRAAVRSPASSRAAPPPASSSPATSSRPSTAPRSPRRTRSSRRSARTSPARPYDDRRAQGHVARRSRGDACGSQGQADPAHRHHARHEIQVPDQDQQQRRTIGSAGPAPARCSPSRSTTS